MKILTLIIGLVCTSTVWAFSSQKPVECFVTADVSRLLQEEFKEIVMFEGANVITGKSKIALYVNSQTGSWTMIEYDSDTACVLAAGHNATT